MTRIVRGGPLLPARVWRPCVCTVNGEDEHDWQLSCDRNPPYQAEINGQPANVDRVWWSRDEITKADFWRRMNNPVTAPNKPVNLRTQAPIF